MHQYDAFMMVFCSACCTMRDKHQSLLHLNCSLLPYQLFSGLIQNPSLWLQMLMHQVGGAQALVHISLQLRGTADP